MLTYLTEGAEIHLEQHRYDHDPDQQADRQIDLGHLDPADSAEQARSQLAKGDAGEDAERDPEAEITLEGVHGGCCRGAGGGTVHGGPGLVVGGGGTEVSRSSAAVR